MTSFKTTLAWLPSSTIFPTITPHISIIYAFYFPRYLYIAVIMQLCSLLSYAPYFQNTQVVNLAYVAFAVLVITVITLADLVLTLYPNIRKRAAVPVPAQSTRPQS